MDVENGSVESVGVMRVVCGGWWHYIRRGDSV